MIEDPTGAERSSDARVDARGGGREGDRGQGMENSRRGRTAADGVEAALACSERAGATSVPNIPERWRAASPVEECENDSAQEAVQGRLKVKSWRPISLLSTLGKILEAVIADRISYAVETFGLSPTTHFGGGKQRSVEQALLLLQEHIYKV